MPYEESLHDWYAIRVMARHEKNVAHVLTIKGIQQMLPLYKTRYRRGTTARNLELPLFPGYVFCSLDPAKRVPVLNTIGVIDFVRTGHELATIAKEEISALQTLMNSGVSCLPWPRLEAGQRVTVEAGPLAGMSGFVIEIKKDPRLVISVSLLQRSVLVEIDRDWVKPDPERSSGAAGSGAQGRSHWTPPLPALPVVNKYR